LGRALGLGLGQSHCGKNTQFGIGPVTLWEEDRLNVFEKEAGEILEPKMEQLTGDWRKPDYWDPHDLYCSPNIIQVLKFKRNEICRAFDFYGKKRNAYSVLVLV
jgi:hypothetical protein